MGGVRLHFSTLPWMGMLPGTRYPLTNMTNTIARLFAILRRATEARQQNKSMGWVVVGVGETGARCQERAVRIALVNKLPKQLIYLGRL